jgi:hypothetical protein
MSIIPEARSLRVQIESLRTSRNDRHWPQGADQSSRSAAQQRKMVLRAGLWNLSVPRGVIGDALEVGGTRRQALSISATTDASFDGTTG